MVAVEGLQIRKAVPDDQQQIANLMFFESHIHRHLDWRGPLEWLGSPLYWVMEKHGEIAAALACPQDPAGIAWIRLFTCASTASPAEFWSALWETARLELSHPGGVIAAAIALSPWFEELLAQSGFVFNQNIVMLEWEGGSFQEQPPARDVKLRPLLAADLPEVVEVDASAFDPLWRNSLDALHKALRQAAYATVAETPQGLAGYQLSTGGVKGVHLARLAVRPDFQGRGLGSALVTDLLRHVRTRGRARVTVNTQSDNPASQALYRRLGFVFTGEQYPVLIHLL